MSRSVLIVDDEQLLVRTLSIVLAEAGYRIDVAGSAEQAETRIFGGASFDLIVLDNRLPNRSGLELVERMRERTDRPKVLLMTAYETPELRGSAARLEVDRYLRKPFDLTVLVDEVRNLIGPAVADPAETELNPT